MNEGWKRWLIKGAAWGASSALMLAAAAGGLLWYSSRPEPPKPWNKTAIKAAFRGISADEDVSTIDVDYTLENTTDRDYSIYSLGEAKMAMLLDDSSLSEFNKYASFDVPLFVPAKHKIWLTLHLKQSSHQTLQRGATEKDRESYRKAVAEFMTNDMAKLNGFVLLDESMRYEIDFRPGWKKLAESKGNPPPATGRQ